MQKVRQYIAGHPGVPIALHVNKVNCGFGNNYFEASFLGRSKYYRLVCGNDRVPMDALACVFRAVGKADLVVPWNTTVVAGNSGSQTANLPAEAGHDPLVGDAGGDAELIPELEFDQTLGWYSCAAGVAHAAERAQGWSSHSRSALNV